MGAVVRWAVVAGGCWLAVSLAAGAIWSMTVTWIKQHGRSPR